MAYNTELKGESEKNQIVKTQAPTAFFGQIASTKPMKVDLGLI